MFFQPQENHPAGHLQLRYHVYCLEFGYLSPDDFPDGQESDEFDPYSVHFCEHSGDNQPVGYVRLIHSKHGSQFPLERRCTVSRSDHFPPRQKAVEISRLVVRQDHRRRRSDRPSVGPFVSSQAYSPRSCRERSPEVLLRLYRKMYAYSLVNDIRYWLAAMERPLARALAINNFAFEKIGPEIDYYGQVTPYVADLRVFEAKLASLNPRLLAWMQLSPEKDE